MLSPILYISQINFRWVYKRVFVADGNFKADHVRQKRADGDVWLSEGAGMIPKREKYHSFLKNAKERLTVSLKIFRRKNIKIVSAPPIRRHLVKIDFKLL